VDKLIYVIAGKEDSLVGVQYQELLDELLEPSQRATGLFSPDPAVATITEVLDELRTAPFLTDKRVVALKQADDFISQNRTWFEKYFDNPCLTGRLILTVRNWDSRTKLAKKLQSVGKLIHVTQPKRWQLPQRLAEYANDSHGKKLMRDAAELLIELTGDELARLYGEIDKLAVYADKDKAITQKHIESLIGHNRLFNAFAVIDAVTDGNAAQAVQRLRDMFAEDRSSEYTVIGAFAYHFRRMFKAKVLMEKGQRADQIAKHLGIWSNQDNFFTRLRKMSLNQIGRFIQYLAESDYAIKTGRSQAQIEMEQFVLKLAG
jgi:DNA polymerase-3 subunit delta